MRVARQCAPTRAIWHSAFPDKSPTRTAPPRRIDQQPNHADQTANQTYHKITIIMRHNVPEKTHEARFGTEFSRLPHEPLQRRIPTRPTQASQPH